MSSILDQVVASFAVESTYGTASGATPRTYEGKADAFSRDTEQLDSVGFRRDLETLRSDRSDTISLGATGSIQTDLLNKGHGIMFQHLLGTSAGPTQVGSTAAYLQTFSTDDTGPTGSYTIQLSRVDSGGTIRAYTYEGAVATGFNISQELGAATSLTVDYDAETEQTSTGEFTPTYPSSADVFTYTDATIEIDDTAATNITSFSLDGDLGMRTDRRFLTGSATKSQPKRASVPSYTGSMSAEFASLTDYNKYVNGTIFKLEFITTMSTAIEGVQYPEFTVTMPAVKFTGSTPVASLDDMTTIELPFTVLSNGSDAAVTITYQSTDTSF